MGVYYAGRGGTAMSVGENLWGRQRHPGAILSEPRTERNGAIAEWSGVSGAPSGTRGDCLRVPVAAPLTPLPKPRSVRGSDGASRAERPAGYFFPFLGNVSVPSPFHE